MKLISKIKSYIKKMLTKEIVKSIKIPVTYGEYLKNRCAVISGGSGGIGYAIAKAFVNNGAYVIILGTNEEKLKAISQELGEKCRYVIFDLTDFISYSVKLKEIVSAFGDNIDVDILVNAAGIMGKSDFFDISEKDWDNVVDVNLKAVYFLTQEISKYMVEKNIEGNILNISSTSALKPGWNPYCISKAGIKSMTLGLADELIKYGIVVNCIAPGPVATKMLQKTDDDLYNPRYKAKRYATAEEIADWAVYMVSDAGRFILGDSLYISGGSGTLDICKNHNF